MAGAYRELGPRSWGSAPTPSVPHTGRVCHGQATSAPWPRLPCQKPGEQLHSSCCRDAASYSTCHLLTSRPNNAVVTACGSAGRKGQVQLPRKAGPDLPCVLSRWAWSGALSCPFEPPMCCMHPPHSGPQEAVVNEGCGACSSLKQSLRQSGEAPACGQLVRLHPSIWNSSLITGPTPFLCWPLF